MTRILLVDQEVEVRLFHRVLFEELEGYEIIDVGTGTAAMEILSREHVDAVVLDLHLPDIDGFQLMSMTRLLHPNLPIIINTGYHQLRDYFNRQGANAFVPKSSGFPELENVLVHLMEETAAKRQYPKAVATMS